MAKDEEDRVLSKIVNKTSFLSNLTCTSEFVVLERRDETMQCRYFNIILSIL